MGEESNTGEHSGAGIAHLTSFILTIGWLVTTSATFGLRMC